MMIKSDRQVEERIRNLVWLVCPKSFADNSDTDAALKQSIIADEQSVFAILRQIERWINRKLKFESGKYKFK